MFGGVVDWFEWLEGACDWFNVFGFGGKTGLVVATSSFNLGVGGGALKGGWWAAFGGGGGGGGRVAEFCENVINVKKFFVTIFDYSFGGLYWNCRQWFAFKIAEFFNQTKVNSMRCTTIHRTIRIPWKPCPCRLWPSSNCAVYLKLES